MESLSNLAGGLDQYESMPRRSRDRNRPAVSELASQQGRSKGRDGQREPLCDNLDADKLSQSVSFLSNMLPRMHVYGKVSHYRTLPYICCYLVRIYVNTPPRGKRYFFFLRSPLSVINTYNNHHDGGAQRHWCEVGNPLDVIRRLDNVRVQWLRACLDLSQIRL